MPSIKQSKKYMEKHFFRTSSSDLQSIPGRPVAYWVSDSIRDIFGAHSGRIGDIANPNQALVTGDTQHYIRRWYEPSISSIGFNLTRESAADSGKKWFPYNKGGDYRNWYGNFEHVLDWENDGHKLRTTLHPSGKRIWAHNFVLESIFKEGVVWSKITSGIPCFRYSPNGFLYDDASGVCSFQEGKRELILGLLCSKVNLYVQQLINPTLNIQPANLRVVPLPEQTPPSVSAIVNSLLELSKSDWDCYETSWDFSRHPLVTSDFHRPDCESAYYALREMWRSTLHEMQHLEEENNRIFIEAYGLEDELTPEVPLNEITLTCNPHYRYRGKKTDEELEELLLADTMREFISYAVGCMFGRYSLDKPGLVLANQGETLADYLTQVPEPSFTPDEDNVIPILDGEWFADDITERFRQFLRVTFGDEHYGDNLHFIEKAIGRDIRRFFLRDFYNDHVRRYKRRPIYWLFSSPQGTFNALIYMHRYQPHTVGTVLGYLRDFRKKLDAHLQHLGKVSISTDVSQGEKTRALKDIDKLRKQILELDDYERDTLYPLATQQIAIDLDDGVKANYPKFGSALKRIVGLEAKDDD